MILEGDFLYRGISRWNLGWATPNYAGAFLVTLACFAWTVRGRGLGRFAVLAAEAAIYFLMVRTFSRGALVALMAAAVYFMVALGWKRLVESRRAWMLRILFIAGCVITTGFAGRIQPLRMKEDGAIIHRLELWRGAVEMIAAAPLRGWGAGESGRAFMNWFQDADESEPYTTMVNSYLHIGVEFGLPALAGVLTVLTWLLVTGWKGAPGSDDRVLAGLPTSPDKEGEPDAERSPVNRPLPEKGALGITRPILTAAAGASLVAWAGANVFSTLWIEPKLWIVPVIAIGVILYVAARQRWREWRRGLFSGVIIGVTGGAILWMVGSYWSGQMVFQIAPLSDGAVIVVRKDRNTNLWHVWTDNEVLGRTPGKEIRRWLGMPDAPGRVIVHLSQIEVRSFPHYPSESVVFFGRQTERLGRDVEWGDQEVIVVHPIGRLPCNAALGQGAVRKRLTVLLPEIDQNGDQARWRKMAEAYGARIVIAAGVGQDLRVIWPGICRTFRSVNSLND